MYMLYALSVPKLQGFGELSLASCISVAVTSPIGSDLFFGGGVIFSSSPIWVSVSSKETSLWSTHRKERHFHPMAQIIMSPIE